MYHYVRAIVKEPGRTGRWVEEQLSGRVVSEVYYQYDEIYLVVTHLAFEGEERAVRLHDVSRELGANRSPLTVYEWLRSIGGAGLPLLDTIPQIETVYAHYRDAWQGGYSIEPVNRTAHHLATLPKLEKTDLRLTKPGVDYQQLFDECLVTVNGLFHRTNFATDALNVADGAASGWHANRSQVGLYRLGTLGKITTVPIEAHHVHKGTEDQKLGEYAYVTVDESADIENKSILLVIGGYLHYIGEVYSRAGERTYVIDFNNYPLAQRFYESRKLIDLSSMEAFLSNSSVNDDQVVVEELYSDDAIAALLTLSQSFFVVVDTPDLFVERHQLEFTGIPGRYQTTVYPNYPMIVSLGKVAEYWARYEEGLYVLNCQEDFATNYTFETAQWRANLTVDPTRVPARVVDYTRAHFLKLGKDL